MSTGKVGPESEQPANYAVFDDYRYSQRIAVAVRWFLLGAWLFLLNYRTDTATANLLILNGMGLVLIALNGFVQWRIWRGRPITRRYVLALSLMDLGVITAGIGVTGRFGNTFFPFYYPALLGVAVVFSSRRLSLAIATAAAAIYATLSLSLAPGVDFDAAEERTLAVRIASMFAVVVAANLMTRIERNRRWEAVEGERVQSLRNLELQRRAQEAELAAQAERHRIAREIHDGIAQSIYALSLNLETCADLADRDEGPLRDQLQRLVPIAKKTLLETRHYIYDLKPLLAGEGDLVAMARNQVHEFQTVSGTKAVLSVEGEPVELDVATATGLYRIMQESLANVLKHAKAETATVALSFTDGRVRMVVEDDGVGFDSSNTRRGYGLDNMQERARELGGSFEVEGVPGEGTRVAVTLPAREVNDHGRPDQTADSGRPRGSASRLENGA